MASAPDMAGVRNSIGPTILLRSGVYFDYLAPHQCAFTIEDIAHGLSNICRFAGHCRHFYSVAQHSVYVSQIVPPELAMAGLLHDAAEAFVGDVAKPLKILLPEYSVIEHRVEAVIFARFAPSVQLPLHPAIKNADLVMLAAEQRALMRNSDEWPLLKGRLPLDMAIPAMAPEEASAFFLERYHALSTAVEEQAGKAPACPPNSDAPAVAPAGVSDPAAQSESCARGTTQTGTGD